MQNIPLISTSLFSHGQYSFALFNHLQSLCYPFHDKDVNMVVAAATSAGKTIVAELGIAHTIAQGKKAIFLSPLKAVTQEKYDDWTDNDHFFSKYKTEIITGDYRLTEDRVANIKKADLILMTSEMLDTRTRYISNENNTWLADVGILVVDEAHLLCTSRGPALEVGLMRFSELNPNAKIILLSATMTNSAVLGKWLTVLNKKQTEVVHTDWRPVELHHHHLRSPMAANLQARLEQAIQIIKVLTTGAGQLSLYTTSGFALEREIGNIRAQSIKAHPDERDSVKTLVFVHAKEEGRKLCVALEGIGIKAFFHNADLDKAARLKLEKKFKEEDLDVLIATSTLAWGINMPARNVVILGNKRGPTIVDDIDIKQMIGRAGRFGMYSRGDAFIICPPNYTLSNTFMIASSLGDIKPLTFHLVAEIQSGSFNTLAGAEAWYARSFAKTSGSHLSIKSALQQLVDCEALTRNGDVYTVTELGKIARDMYLNPKDIFRWKENFNRLVDYQWQDNTHLAFAFTNKVSLFDMDYVPKDIKPLAVSYHADAGMKCRPQVPSNFSDTYGAVIWYRLNRVTLDEYAKKKYDGPCALFAQVVIKDIGRIFGALHRLNRLENWNAEHHLKSLQMRILYSVGAHLLELVTIPGVGETIAMQLYDAGLQNIQSVRDNKDKLSKLITRKASVTKILKGLEQLDTQNNAVSSV